MKKEQKAMNAFHEERTSMQMAYDDIQLKYKIKFEDFLELEKKSELCAAENELLK